MSYEEAIKGIGMKRHGQRSQLCQMFRELCGPGQCSSGSWSIIPNTERSPVQFPIRTHTWVAGTVPGRSACERQPIDVSLTSMSVCLSAYLSLSLSLGVYTRVCVCIEGYVKAADFRDPGRMDNNNDNNNSKYWHGPCYAPDTVPSAFHLLTRLNLSTTLWGRHY